jgi:serine/threonine-protein kinase
MLGRRVAGADRIPVPSREITPLLLRAGKTVAHYRLVEPIGQGGMGVVWKAVDTSLARSVAIKFLSDAVPRDRNRLARFRREAQAIAALNHPNIVTIYSVEEAEGLPFITMELVTGRNLAESIPEGGLPLRRFFELAVALADALDASHQREIVHRDLKPGNIMIGEDGRARIVDFGLAQLREATPSTAGYDSSVTTVSRDSRFAGTLPYMSPEQLQGRAADPRSDIFSLGSVLYQMATGHKPFRGETTADLIAAILRGDPVPVTRLNRAAPRQLERIIDRCLRKDPRRRFQTALDVRNELEELRREWTSGTDRDGPGEGYGVATPLPRDRRSLVVLPLRNLTTDAENDYFSDGMTEDLINALARVEGLRVVSRTSAFAFRDLALSVQEIGRRLGVGTALEGSVRRIDQRVRVTVQLVDARDGYHLWSSRYDRELEDFFAIQDDIIRSIVQALEVELVQPSDVSLLRHYTENLDAYQLYLKGRYHWHQETAGALQRAIGYFEQALKEDPDYAPAHCGVADYYVMLGFWGLVRPAEVWPLARDAAVRALELDPDLAEAHVSLGLVQLFFDWDAEGAEGALRRALELNPGSGDVHYARTLVHAQRGEMASALEAIARARALDPLSPIMSSTEGWVHYYARQHEEAVTACRRTLDLDADFLEAHIGLGLAHKEMRQFDRALKELERAGALSERNPLVLGVLGATLAEAGREDEALELAGELDAKPGESYVAPVAYAMLFSGLRDKDRTFDALRRALAARDGLVRYLKVFPIFDPVRDEPEFRELLERLNLSNDQA